MKIKFEIEVDRMGNIHADGVRTRLLEMFKVLNKLSNYTILSAKATYEVEKVVKETVEVRL
jgi:hypothetical protein